MERKITKKLLAILMIITILSTDFFVLGSNLITYAAQIDSQTNNSNIEFSAYFKSGKDKIDSIEKSIKSEDLKLYAEIKVKNEGYFNGTIEIQNSNFKLKNNILSSAIASIEGNKVNLKQINAGDVVEIELDIEPIISDKIAVDMLSKTSTVKLTGTYMETTYKGLDIEAEKSVSVNYKPDETAEAELETDIITNKVFSVNGTNKRIVQLSIKSRLAENQYPVEQTILNIDIPELSEKAPEEINVLAIGKLATNGETEISSENWVNENGILKITLDNKADSNNEIAWNKDVYDELVVTFIYAEDVDASKVEITTDSELKLNNSNNTYTATNTKGIENQEPNNIVMEKSEITTTELYKGKLYANLEEQYNTKTTLIITNSDVADEIVAHEGPDVFGTDESELAADTKYISTEINKDKMLQILGQDGNIEIKNGEKTILINANTEANESGNIVINYDNSTSELDITTSKPVNAGILEIKHVKTITGNSYTREQLKTVKTIKTKSSVVETITVDKQKQNIAENSTEAKLELKETISKAELTVNKENLSTTEVNEVIVGVKLITDGVKYDLYKNPSIKLQLPSAVENVELTAAPSKLYADEFDISAKYDNTNKIIQIDLKGEQTAYPESSATQLYLQLNLNITLSKLATTQTDKITMKYINANASQYDGGSTDVGIVEQAIGISAPTGLMKMFNLSLNENTSTTEALTQQVEDKDAGKNIKFETILVNNIDSDMNNVRIIGKLPTTGNTISEQEKENTFETKLTSINASNATIYYTENVDATSNINDSSNGWTTNLADLTNAKLYLIKLDTLAKGSNYTATTNIQIPSTIAQNAASYTEYQVIYDTATETDVVESSRTIALLTSTIAALETKLTAQVGQDILTGGETIKEGEVIKYTATVKNSGSEGLQNVAFKAQVPEGTVLVEPKEDYVYDIGEDRGYYVEKEDTEISETIELAAGQTYTLQYEVRVKTDITEGTEISNKAIITYGDSTMESNEIKNTLAESNIRITIKRAVDESIELIAGSSMKYFVYIDNLSDEKVTNLKLNVVTNNLSDIFFMDTDGQIVENIDGKQIAIDEISANGRVMFGVFGQVNDTEDLNTYMTITDSNNLTYRSNFWTESIASADATVTLSSPQDKAYIKEGDIVEYNITIANTGDINGTVVLRDNVSSYLEIQEIRINNELLKQITDNTDENTYVKEIGNSVLQNIDLNAGESAQIYIKAKVVEMEDSTVITNKADIDFNDVYRGESEEVTHILTDGSTSIEEPKYTINGIVWIDENENGQKDSDEKGLENVIVKLLDTSTGNYATNEYNNLVRGLTDSNGEYTISEVEKGSYRIVLEYDTEEYEPATKSIVKLQNLTVNGEVENICGTEVVTVQDNISDMNMALKEIKDDTQTEDPETPEEPENPETPEEPENPNNPETPEEPENPTEVKDTKSISGSAWLDEDRDGEKDSGEKALSGIKIRLYSVSTKNYLKDDNGNIVETTTDASGEYTFSNIEKGSYIVLFEYDTEKYEPTTYLANTDATKNSSAVLKNININGEELTLAVTDTINLQDDVSNINIGLKEKLIFDLELNKYISKIVVQNSKETKTYDYDNKEFAKVEIHRKQVQGSLVVLEYTIKVKNTGEIPGYAKNIVDYLPSGLTFSSELNNDWYLSGDYLYTKGLENVQINPGEEKEIKLILTKSMTNENVGLINNRAEIYQDYNKYGEVDTDSTPNNQAQNEDDFGSVDVIIGIKTGGSTIANIILLLINLVLIGVVIRLMIKNGIIKITTKRGRR